MSANNTENVELSADLLRFNFQQVFQKIEVIEKKSLLQSPKILANLSFKMLQEKGEDLKKWTSITKAYKEDFATKIDIPLERIKILFVTAIFPDTNHGGGLRVFDLINELSDKGHEVYLYTCAPQYQDSESYNILKQVCCSVNVVESSNFTEPMLTRWIIKRSLIFDLGYYIWPESVNLFPTNRALIKKIAFEFIECTVRRLWIDFLTIDDKESSIEDLLFNFWTHYYCETCAAKQADILITLTPKDHDFVKGLYFNMDSLVSLTGISSLEFDKNVISSVNLVSNSACFIGNYDHYPNIDGLVWYLDNIHEKVVSNIPDYTFSIIGYGAEVALEKLRNEYERFSSSIRWVGPVDKVAESLVNYTICLCPLVSGAGLRGKVIQYSALRKATVSTTIGICGMPFKDNESIFVADSIDVFAQKTVLLLRETELRTRIAESAYNLAWNHFSWTREIQKLETHFRVGCK